MEKNTKCEKFGQTDKQTESQTTDSMRTENSGELKVIVLINQTLQLTYIL